LRQRPGRTRHSASVTAHSKLKEAAAKNKPLTSSEAARMTGYSRDHIGLLCRRKFVGGTKFGRDWVVDPQSLLAYVASAPKVGRRAS